MELKPGGWLKSCIESFSRRMSVTRNISQCICSAQVCQAEMVGFFCFVWRELFLELTEGGECFVKTWRRIHCIWKRSRQKSLVCTVKSDWNGSRWFQWFMNDHVFIYGQMLLHTDVSWLHFSVLFMSVLSCRMLQTFLMIELFLTAMFSCHFEVNFILKWSWFTLSDFWAHETSWIIMCHNWV